MKCIYILEVFLIAFTVGCIKEKKESLKTSILISREPFFNHKKEVTLVESNFQSRINNLSFSQETPTTSDVKSELVLEPPDVKIGGVRLVFGADKQRKISPIYSSSNEYEICMILELPEPNLTITNIYMEKAVTDTNESILPAKRERVPFPKMSSDGQAVYFNLKLNLPDENTKSLAELSGKVEYIKSKGTKKINLGLMDFKKGATSDIEGFSIKNIYTSSYDKEHTRMKLGADIDIGSLKSVKFLNEDGKEIEIKKSGKTSTSEKIIFLEYKIEGKFPRRGQIIFEVLDNVTKHILRFKMKNISLFGRPL